MTTKENIISMTTYTDGFKPHVETDPLRVYKWLAETMVERYRGSKDIKRIVYHEKYDGWRHITYYISNGTRVEVSVPRS